MSSAYVMKSSSTPKPARPTTPTDGTTSKSEEAVLRIWDCLDNNRDTRFWKNSQTGKLPPRGKRVREP